MERIDYGERAGKEKKERARKRERGNTNVDRKVGIKVWAFGGEDTKRHTHALTCSTVPMPRPEDPSQTILSINYLTILRYIQRFVMPEFHAILFVNVFIMFEPLTRTLLLFSQGLTIIPFVTSHDPSLKTLFNHLHMKQ